MIWSAHTDQQATIWHPFDQGLNFGLLRTKRLFHIERHFHEGTPSARVLDDCCERLFCSHGFSKSVLITNSYSDHIFIPCLRRISCKYSLSPHFLGIPPTR